ncbi:MAG: polysaccharide deacetylase family protein [Muribaculaceae bacterium]|nr:polysaccharide deacetylase family protein [Muribaculaceae bacterium]
MLLPQERIPWILRFPVFRREVLFRVEDGKPSVYLTFDDGPIPESTPWLLKTLEEHGAKATFFMVADNARRYPELFRAVVKAGHAVGNHTFHHIPPFRQSTDEMLADVRLAEETFLRLKAQDLRLNLFRPPHGLILRRQQKALSEAGYRIVMFDLNTLDYRADRTPEAILASVKANVRPGCIINLHDSLKSIEKLKRCLPEILDYLVSQGYAMAPLSFR